MLLLNQIFKLEISGCCI